MSGLQERSRGGMPVRVVGIDCQATTPDALLALERLAARDAATAAQLREELELVVGEKARGMRHPELVRGLDTQQLERYIKVLERLEAACAGDARAVDAARRARQGLASFRPEASDAKPEEASMEDWSLRDRFMAENLLADGSHRGVFWGHNVHVFGGRPNGQLEGYRPSGSFLREALGSRYRVVLFDYVTAEIRAVPVPTDGSQPDATQPTAVSKREVLPAALAAELDGLDERSHWVDLAALERSGVAGEWFATPRAVDWPGYAMLAARGPEDYLVLPLEGLCDVLVVLERMGPSRPLR